MHSSDRSKQEVLDLEARGWDAAEGGLSFVGVLQIGPSNQLRTHAFKHLSFLHVFILPPLKGDHLKVTQQF